MFGGVSWPERLSGRCGINGMLEITEPILKNTTMIITGAIAQLARVLAWQARGQGFESP